VFFTDPRYTIQARAEVGCAVRVATGTLVAAIGKALARRKPQRLGYEPARMTCEARDLLARELPAGVRLKGVRGWIERLRTVKSAAEVAAIRRSVETNSRAFEQAVRRARVGMSECDLATEIEYRMRRLGAEKPAFETIVAAGARSALPHARPTRAPIRPGGLVLVDMGAFVAGYASDMARMLHAGEPGRRTKRLYGAVLEAQRAAVDAVRPGATAGDVDGAARRVLQRHGLAAAFVHSTGHGLGLEIHEAPRLGRRDATPLETGMAITVEPGVYIEGFGGIRIEDTVIVTPTGCEILTPTGKQLRVI
jgi:Xaa-Pro aminopeptidase